VQAGYITTKSSACAACIRIFLCRWSNICASGGYYVAVAADKIYVDKASIVGSIGVVMDGFGFTGTMEAGCRAPGDRGGRKQEIPGSVFTGHPAHKAFAEKCSPKSMNNSLRWCGRDAANA
jgi:hypothetical protein